jgi:methylmalonyl-CoA epimerase
VPEIDHVGIAVEDLAKAVREWQCLGFELLGMEEAPEHGVRVALFRAGHSRVELMEPMGPESPVARFLSKRGPGIHHIAFSVEGVKATLDELKAKGVPLVDQVPRRGAGGTEVAFLHPRGASGCLVELCEGHEEQP